MHSDATAGQAGSMVPNYIVRFHRLCMQPHKMQVQQQLLVLPRASSTYLLA
jgi:hypothetical protein